MARFRCGALDYALGGHPVWELFRTVYQMTKRPFAVGGLMLLAGYVWAMARRVEGSLRAVVRVDGLDHRGRSAFCRALNKNQMNPRAEVRPLRHKRLGL